MEYTQEVIVQKAKIAEQAERYDDMVEAMKTVTQTASALSDEERSLLSVAYKNAVGSRRSSWRIIKAIQQNADMPAEKMVIVKDYLAKIEKELTDICEDVLNLLDKFLVPNAGNPESKVYYLKMRGDYYRYLAEIASEDERPAVVEKSEKSYQEAFDTASESLPGTHAIRLGLALNFSVFYYEILSSPEKATKMARGAFDGAIGDIDSLMGDAYKNSIFILGLLRDNLTLWRMDDTPDEQDAVEPGTSNE